jgi:D-alanyl-D-alanine carboxypeptidase
MLTATQLLLRSALTLVAVAAAPGRARAQDTLPPATRAAIDSTALDVLARTGAPSASVAVVRHGRIA